MDNGGSILRVGVHRSFTAGLRHLNITCENCEGWLYTIILGSNSTKQVAFVVYIWFSRREQEYIIFVIFTIHHHAPQYIIDKCISGANHGPPRIIQCPPKEALGYNARKSKIHS